MDKVLKRTSLILLSVVTSLGLISSINIDNSEDQDLATIVLNIEKSLVEVASIDKKTASRVDKNASNENKTTVITDKVVTNAPLIKLLDGKPVSYNELDSISLGEVSEITILLNKDELVLYGAKGVKGIIKISTIK